MVFARSSWVGFLLYIDSLEISIFSYFVGGKVVVVVVVGRYSYFTC